MSNIDNHILVEVVDSNGNLDFSFSPKMGESFVDGADRSGFEIPTSCCAGACFTCACRVIQWEEDIERELLSIPLVDLEEDQMLTCIGWLKDHVFHDGRFHHIILQKLL